VFDFSVLVQMHIGTMRATSRGQLTLQSADPIKAPVLDFNYLSTEDDIRDLRACIPIARQVCISCSHFCYISSDQSLTHVYTFRSD